MGGYGGRVQPYTQTNKKINQQYDNVTSPLISVSERKTVHNKG